MAEAVREQGEAQVEADHHGDVAEGGGEGRGDGAAGLGAPAGCQ